MTQVLIVDDNAENLYLLRMLLQGHGYTVEEACNGAEALVKACQQPPDLIISDLLMPVLDGYTLLRNWRADEKLKNIPFIVYTATYTEPRDERLALAMGADLFLLKPAEPEQLMVHVDAVLAEHASGKLRSAVARTVDEHTLLKDYNEVLVRKLEKKALQLGESNRDLLEKIAERKVSQDALDLRDRAIQAVSQGIVITDPRQPDNPIIYAGAGFERMTGYRPEEVLGRNCRFLQGKDTDPETVCKLRDAIAGEQACTVEILNYRKDGTSFWNELSLNPVHADNGTLSYFISVQSDITDRKRLEEQLRQSQKMDAIGRLAGGVAHDFNNLLTVISSYSELLLAMPDVGGTAHESAKAIREASERATSLTRQLLGFSRQTMLQPKVLDLNSVVTETGKLLQRLIGEDIQLTIVLEPSLQRVKVDPAQLDQVLINLAVNARDAMPTGGKLTIGTANVLLSNDYVATHLDCKAGPHVMLAITDTGCGMASEVMDRIFEPFFTTKEVGKGTGLGLSMVFGIVQQSNGCIHVYSEPGHGTTFKIYLPAVTEDVAAITEVARESAVRGTETILLVEDDELVRELALMGLQMHGYKVLFATDGQDALRIVQEYREPIDLVLTDVVMPKVSGPELARRLHAQHPRIRVLFMSGYTDDAVVRHGLLEASVAFIQKPYTLQGLARKVRGVLDGDKATLAAAAT